jgi:Zn-dependent metalloprotease
MLNQFLSGARIGLILPLLLGTGLTGLAQTVDELPGKIRVGRAMPQPAARPAPEVVGYWNLLNTRAGGPLGVSWNAKNGTPEGIFGKIEVSGRPASELAARRFLVKNAPLFKMRSGADELRLSRGFESPLGRHFVFEQEYNGVPVYNGMVAVHFDQAGAIIAIGNTFEPDISLNSVEPAVDRSYAAELARDVVDKKAADASAKLFVYDFDGSYHLAWRVVLSEGGPTWESFVDAQSGEPLGEPRDINRYVNGTGQIFRVNAVVATRDNSLRDNDDAASAVPPSAYSIATLAGLVGNGYLDGEFASSSKTKKRAFDIANSFVFDRNNDGFSETMGYYYLDYAERYIQSLGFNNINNRQQVFSVNKLKIDNSYYSPQSQEITFGIGGVDDAEDADVILHEYGHSIQDNQVTNFGSSLEAGSMGEGFGDYWAGTVGAQFSGGFQDECLAEWDATSYSSSNPPCLRRLDGTKHYPEDVAGEVHDDGEIWSAALWEIRGAIGAANADRTVLASHFLLTPTASFDQGANALVTSAVNLGLPSRYVTRIRGILQNRGFTVTV